MIRILLLAALAVAIGGAGACYPKNCDPATDPLRCQCPPGPCGPFPEASATASAGRSPLTPDDAGKAAPK